MVTFWDFKLPYLYRNTKSRLRQRVLQAAFRILYLVFLVESSILVELRGEYA
jgi:hypothetical protein